jgi:hypothetical protein
MSRCIAYTFVRMWAPSFGSTRYLFFVRIHLPANNPCTEGFFESWQKANVDYKPAALIARSEAETGRWTHNLQISYVFPVGALEVPEVSV